jgi:hypothetical protein
VSNVLSEEKKQQVVALGRLGWSLRRIERAAYIRRETVGAYSIRANCGVQVTAALLSSPQEEEFQSSRIICSSLNLI